MPARTTFSRPEIDETSQSLVMPATRREPTIDDIDASARARPAHRPATDEEDAIPVPDGYPLDHWSPDDDTGWPFAVHPDLRALYAGIPATSPDLVLDPDYWKPFAFAEQSKARKTWVRYVVEAWPAQFRIGQAPYDPRESSTATPIGDTWALHKARLAQATDLWNDAIREQQETARLANQRNCPICGRVVTRLYERHCDRCHDAERGITATFGRHALEDVDGRPRWVAVLDHLADTARQGARPSA